MSDEQTKPKRATRDGEGRRVPLMGRTTIGLRKCLEDAAGVSGRSLAQEVERRLEQSFDAPALIDALAARLADGIASRAPPARAATPAPCVFCGAVGWCGLPACLGRKRVTDRENAA